MTRPQYAYKQTLNADRCTYLSLQQLVIDRQEIR